jgi:hypothetical protein
MLRSAEATPARMGAPSWCLGRNDVRPIHGIPQPPSSAGEHFADVERILAALPIVKRNADRDRHVQMAPSPTAILAVAAGMLGATIADYENDEEPSANGDPPG